MINFLYAATGLGAVIALILIISLLILLVCLVYRRIATSPQRTYKLDRLVAALGKGLLASADELESLKRVRLKQFGTRSRNVFYAYEQSELPSDNDLSQSHRRTKTQHGKAQ